MSGNAQTSLFEEPRHPVGVRGGAAAIDAAFARPALETPTREIRDMVRPDDPITAQVAAVKALPRRSALKRRILEILATEGPSYRPEGLTDRELETRNEFRGYAPSTVRCRRKDLFKEFPPAVEANGERDGLTVWRIPTLANEATK